MKLKTLGDILVESAIPADNPSAERRIRVRLNAEGVEKRPLLSETEGATRYFSRYAGQFIYGKQNLHKGAFGIIPSELDGFESSSDLPAFDVSDQCRPKWLEYFFKQGNYYKSLVSIARGAATKRIQPNELFKVKLPIPTLKIQDEIIAQMDSYASTQSDLQNEITHQQSLLAKLKQAILQEAIQGKLTEDWRAAHPDVEPASQILKRIQAEKARLIAEKKLRPEKPLPKITPAEIPFEIPKGWEWCSLGSLGYTQTGTTPDTTVPENFGNFIPFIKPADIDDVGITYEEKGLTERGLSEGRLIEPDSIMMVCIGSSTGKVAVNDRPVSCNQQINAITFLDEVHERCVEFILKSPYFQTALWAATKTGITPIINKSKWAGIAIPLPPLAEQSAIVERVEALMEHCRALEVEIVHARTHAAHLLQAVLKEAFAPAT